MVGNLEDKREIWIRADNNIVHGLERYNKQGVTIQNYIKKTKSQFKIPVHHEWLIDWIVFYAKSAIFQPYNGGLFHESIKVLQKEL